MELMNNIDSIVWAVATIIFVVVEAITVALVTIWFAVGALATIILSFFTDNWILQIGCFLVVSIITLILTRYIKKDFLNKSIIETNTPALIGTIGIVTKKISRAEKGRVTVDGKDWLATGSLEMDDKIIDIDKEVIVVGVKGVTLIVREK